MIMNGLLAGGGDTVVASVMNAERVNVVIGNVSTSDSALRFTVPSNPSAWWLVYMASDMEASQGSPTVYSIGFADSNGNMGCVSYGNDQTNKWRLQTGITSSYSDGKLTLNSNDVYTQFTGDPWHGVGNYKLYYIL